MDLYFSESGDLKLSPTRDLALTDTGWREKAQTAYMIVQTEPGDFTLYPRFGANLSELYGMPQSAETGEYGKKIIEDALTRYNSFKNSEINVVAIPTGPQTIRFDIYIINGSKKQMTISVEQKLGLT
jgi:hypothetical protein